MPISNLSSGLRPGVCTSTTRPTAPFEGQMIYETDTNRVLVWDNAAWVVPNAPAQNPTGLELITTVTCSSGGTASNGVVTINSSVSSVTIDNAFSATYDNYLIRISGGATDANRDGFLKLGSTSSGYYTQLTFGSYGSTAQAVAINNGSGWQWAFSGSTTSLYGRIELTTPFLAERTFIMSQWAQSDTAGQTNGFINDTTSYTSFNLSVSAGSMTGGTVRVYGYRNS